MASYRRSGRAKKSVNYSLDKDSPRDSSDDDFQDSPGNAAPPPKKAKTSTIKPKPKLREEKEKKKTAQQTEKPKERLSLDEKLYKRELEAAIQASIKDSQSGEDISLPPSDDDETETLATEVKPAEETKEEKENDKENEKSIKSKEILQASSSRDEDNNEQLMIKKAKKQTAKSKVVNHESDEDFSETNSHSVDSDFEMGDDGHDSGDADDDSDFDAEMDQKSKKKKERKTKPVVAASPSKPPIKPRSSATVTPIKMLKKQQRAKSKNSSTASSIKSISSVSSSASNSPSSSMMSSGSHKIKSPLLGRSLSPGLGLGGVNIKSSGMPIRLGLSRNVRVKPLHSNVTIQQR